MPIDAPSPVGKFFSWYVDIPRRHIGSITMLVIANYFYKRYFKLKLYLFILVSIN